MCKSRETNYGAECTPAMHCRGKNKRDIIGERGISRRKRHALSVNGKYALLSFAGPGDQKD